MAVTAMAPATVSTEPAATEPAAQVEVQSDLLDHLRQPGLHVVEGSLDDGVRRPVLARQGLATPACPSPLATRDQHPGQIAGIRQAREHGGPLIRRRFGQET